MDIKIKTVNFLTVVNTACSPPQFIKAQNMFWTNTTPPNGFPELIFAYLVHDYHINFISHKIY